MSLSFGKRAKRSDLALSFENGGSNVATVARRGSSGWQLEVTAKTGHSSQIFKESTSLIFPS